MNKKAIICNKIKELYPDVTHHQICIKAAYHDQQEAWIIKLKKHRLHSAILLEDEDVDRILSGQKCLTLTIEILQLVDNMTILSL